MGVGYVAMTLDHGTGTVRVGYDNVAPEQMVAMATTLKDVGESLLGGLERQRWDERASERLQKEKAGA